MRSEKEIREKLEQLVRDGARWISYDNQWNRAWVQALEWVLSDSVSDSLGSVVEEADHG